MKSFSFMNNLKYQMIFYFGIVIILCTSFIGIFSYKESSDNIEKDIVHAYSQTLLSVIQNIETHIDYYDRLSKRLALSDDAMTWYNVKKNSIESIEVEEKLTTNHFMTLFWDKQDIEQITLISNNGNIFRKSHLFLSLTDPRTYSWYENMPAEDYRFISPVYTQREDYWSRKVITVVRKFNNFSTGTYDYIFIDLRLKELNNIISSVSLAENGYLIIVHPDGSLVLHPDSSKIGEQAESPYADELSDSKGFFFSEEQGQKNLVVYKPSEGTGWKVFAVLPYSEIAPSIFKVRDFTLIIATLSTIIAILIAIYIAQRVTRPLYQLKMRMSQVRRGDLSVRVPIQGRDEVASLSLAFNHMLDQINQLIESNYRSKIRETEANLKQREASLEALQAQINPHFLYNCLETINAMAVVANQSQISKFSIALAEILRYSADIQSQFVPLRQEIEYAKLFLSIQKIRYEDQLQVHFSIPEELMDNICLKLSIQPLVENSCKHGLHHRKKILHINISARKHEDQIIILITNDGLKTTEITGNRKEKNSSKLGLENLNSRLMLSFGPEYKLVIDRRPEGIFSVEMKFPLRDFS